MCRADIADAYLCGSCMTTLRARLVGGHGHGSVGQLVGQLHLTLARQHKVGGASTGIRARSADTPLPYNEGASKALLNLHSVLSWAIRTLAGPGKGPQYLTDIGVGGEAHGYALVLAGPRYLQLARTQPAGPDIHHAIIGAVGRGWAVIDRPADQQYAGPCDECGRDMYASPGAAEVACDCGLRYDASARRAWLLGRVEDQLITAVDASRALPGLLERDLSVDTIRSWIHRNRILVRAYLHDGTVVPARVERTDQPLCRAGDLIDLAMEQRKADDGRRKAKAG